MDVYTPIRPRRSLAFPFVVAVYPLLSLVALEAEVYGLGQPVTDVLPQVIALIAVAVVISYAVAVVVATLLVPETRSVPSWARPIVVPSNATLVTVSFISIGLVTYFVASSLGIGFPSWLAPTERGVGLLLGWPMVISILVTYAIANAFPAAEVPFAIELLVAMIGVAFTAVWLFLLASGTVTLASRAVSIATTQ